MRAIKPCWKCELCNHEWIAISEIPPRQCAKCRKVKWHTGIDVIAESVYSPVIQMKERKEKPVVMKSELMIEAQASGNPYTEKISKRHDVMTCSCAQCVVTRKKLKISK